MNPICFYHRADFDGVCSAAIVKKFVPDCELYGIDYGDAFPWDKIDMCQVAMLGAPEPEKRAVYMVDFSLHHADMLKLSQCCDLVWIDHHESAIDAVDELGLGIAGMREVGHAACELCWAWFTAVSDDGQERFERGFEPDDWAALETPEAVRLLGRYDVWDAENPDWARIEAFQFGMRAYAGLYDPVHPVWAALLEPGAKLTLVPEFVGGGDAILSYRDQEAKQLCADGAGERELFIPTDKSSYQAGLDPTGNRYVLVCLNSLQRGSWQFNSVWDPAKHDAMCVYGQLKDGRWRVSLYSTKDDVDCGAICKSLGGGGHKGAAGFICDELPWCAR